MLNAEEPIDETEELPALKSPIARLIIGAITSSNSVLNEAAMDVEINATRLSTLFTGLTGNAETQTARLSDLVGQISTVEYEGEEISLVDLPNILQESLADVTERILVLSKQGVSLIYSLDEILEEIGELGTCIDEIEAINRQTRLLSLNAQIESGRAGKAALGFQVVSTEMHNLSRRIDSLSERMRNSIGAVTKNIEEVIGSIRDEYQKMSDIGAMDLTKQLDAKDHLEKLLLALVERNTTIQVVLDDSATASRNITREISDVVTAMQFQDRLNQRCEAVVMALDALSDFVGKSPNLMASVEECETLSRYIVDNIRLHDVKTEFLRELLGEEEAEQYNEADIAPAIELF